MIVINGRDYSQGGKAFTLLHELPAGCVGEKGDLERRNQEFSASRRKEWIERFLRRCRGGCIDARATDYIDGSSISTVCEWTDSERMGSPVQSASAEGFWIRFVNLKRATCGFYAQRTTRSVSKSTSVAEKKARTRPDPDQAIRHG